MPTVQEEVSSDFFNNVATIAGVLMFAKVASHGLRKARGKPARTLVFAILHGVAVVFAIIAITAALIATYRPSVASDADVFAWCGVVVAALALIIDIGIEEFYDARCGKRSQQAKPEGGKPNGSAVREAPPGD
jgi:hypothetical protein